MTERALARKSGSNVVSSLAMSTMSSGREGWRMSQRRACSRLPAHHQRPVPRMIVAEGMIEATISAVPSRDPSSTSTSWNPWSVCEARQRAKRSVSARRSWTGAST